MSDEHVCVLGDHVSPRIFWCQVLEAGRDCQIASSAILTKTSKTMMLVLTRCLDHRISGYRERHRY